MNGFVDRAVGKMQNVWMPDWTTLALERRADGVAWLTMNRPAVFNAFDEGLIAELDDAFSTLGADPTVRVIVLAGAGKHFSAGADLQWMQRAAAASQEANLAALAPPRTAPRPIQASVGRDVLLIPPDEVVYFEADQRYTRVVHQGGDALIRTPLRELLTQLDPEQFWQIHRSVLVNSRCIARAVRIDEGNMVLLLRGRDEKLPVSRQFQALFKGQ